MALPIFQDFVLFLMRICITLEYFYLSKKSCDWISWAPYQHLRSTIFHLAGKFDLRFYNYLFLCDYIFGPEYFRILLLVLALSEIIVVLQINMVWLCLNSLFFANYRTHQAKILIFSCPGQGISYHGVSFLQYRWSTSFWIDRANLACNTFPAWSFSSLLDFLIAIIYRCCTQQLHQAQIYQTNYWNGCFACRMGLVYNISLGYQCLASQIHFFLQVFVGFASFNIIIL